MSEETEKDMQDMQMSSLEEDVKYRQGRSRYRVEQTEKVTFIIIFACILGMSIMWYTSI
jgi:cell division protein FtsL